MKDARRRPRDVVDQFMPVHNRETGVLVGYLTDVTVDGGMLESETAFDSGEFIPLRIELSEELGGSHQIDVDARCRWARKDRNAVFFNVGFQFEDVSPEIRVRLDELADRYRLKTGR